MVKKIEIVNIFLMCCLASGLAVAQDMSADPASIESPPAEYSPYLQHHYPDRVFFGDTHLHTSYSTDAGLFANRLGPDEAYRFAKGEEVTACFGHSTFWWSQTTPKTLA
jgi:hypothetical protein